MGLLRYTLNRFLQAIPVMFGIAVITFLLVNSMPGNPVDVMLAEQDASPELIQAIEERYGLDEPLHIQFLNYIGFSWFLAQIGFPGFADAPPGLLQGDLGLSMYYERPVSDLMLTRLPPTLLLMMSAFAFALVTAIPLGVLAATRRNQPADHVSRIVALIGVSTPSFWIGIMLIILFSVQLGWLPSGRLVYPWRDPSHYGYGSTLELYYQTVRHLILPMIALGTLQMATIMRVERSSMIESLQKEYVKLARAYGVSERKILRKHAFRPSQLPVVTLVGLNLTSAIGGAVLIEMVFSINGMGRLLIQSIQTHDYQLVLGTTVVIGFVFVIGVIITDIAYAYIDPRVSYGEGS
ncbi:ABC transporter permease [Halorubrum vacuolatum]|uniref:Peptide/nickel transport system permease protein n=1 Tax=Halorubrum vacuolatum TaxID=63740 RepID=A0A238VNE3_HALVU|nr:ABC transporter permease [Halorubrum vacuolatum]SNR35684.1 peptide/nickel transport system permease protein [Halorubrum vacuolatum]